MRKMMKTIGAFALAGTLMLGLTPYAAANSAETTAAAEEAQSEVFASCPENLDEWTINDIQTYLSSCELINNDEFLLIPMSSTDVEPISAAGGFMYMDTAAASVILFVYAFDPADEASAATLESVIENQAVLLNGTPVAVMDSVVGQFAFSFMNGTDDDYIADFIQALNALAEHFGIAPEFMPEF